MSAAPARSGNGVCAVVVVYRRAPSELAAPLRRLLGQVDRVVVVDNTPADADADADADARDATPLRRLARCQVILNGVNRGIAAALNQGIAAARAAGCEAILLLDQDSRPAADMVERLLRARRRLAGQRRPLAALGATAFDRRRRRPLPFRRYRGLWPAAARPRPGGVTVAVDALLTSGSLLNASALTRIGPMDESLFIDDVDYDWCFRARAAGFALYGVSDAVFDHALGESRRRLPWVGREFAIHVPARQYYLARNHLLLMRRRHVPLSWKLKQLCGLGGRLVVFSLFVAPRAENFRALCRGLYDGLRGRAGRGAGGL